MNIEIIETVNPDEWVQIERHDHGGGGQHCNDSQAHEIPPGEGYVDIVHCRREKDGGIVGLARRRYCTTHADAHVEQVQAMEADRIRRQGKHDD